ncbi:hypothetical protein Tc00.1047053505939.10 [Trypanosoma cruzi]|uniref:Uncharacterized protein n=1 Tax=Trypanosoma cruzi (strain CL Brener) TaxID=353153 RepID=Q4D6L2_TRYCC|nr:hypothetical protein Tc00.1047053505939.10 [Trypanosoma cruzi]EAN88155.1 hypothetical protein Tc00.1047053505939.10 [Trypanosoma cruzi]|eukprot:XP_810006.1 hypothetical protein [Trypanosoma cruzi strain CL Brener]
MFPIRTHRTVARGWLSEHIDVVGTNIEDVARPLPLHGPLLSRPVLFIRISSGLDPQPRGTFFRACQNGSLNVVGEVFFAHFFTGDLIQYFCAVELVTMPFHAANCLVFFL